MLEYDSDGQTDQTTGETEHHGLKGIGADDRRRISPDRLEDGNGRQLFSDKGMHGSCYAQPADEQRGQPNQAEIAGQLIQELFQLRLGVLIARHAGGIRLQPPP